MSRAPIRTLGSVGDANGSDGPRVWLITGASGGLGGAFVDAARARGDTVVAARRSTPPAGPHGPNDRAADDNAGRLVEVTMDVTDTASVRAAVDAALSQVGRIDVVVNAAGAELFGAVEELDPDALRRLFDLNVVGAMRVLQAVLPGMRARRSGRIVNISSVSGLVGNAGLGGYCATKFALEGLSEALAEEVAPFGVHVTLVEPGPFRTQISDAATRSTALIGEYAETAGRTIAFLSGLHAHAPGDPARAGRALVAVADMADPPLRVPLGAMALEAVAAKIERVGREFQQGRALALSTDHAA